MIPPLLEAPVRVAERRQRAEDRLRREVEFERHGDGRERVREVVGARDRHPQAAELPSRRVHRARGERPLVGRLAAADVGLDAETVRDHALSHLREDLAHPRVVDAEDHGAVEGHLVRERRERLADALQVRPEVEVLAVDRRDHRPGRRQREEAPVALVGLGHEKFTLAEPRVRTEGVEPPADDRGRVEVGRGEDRGDERGGRRLAVRARDGDAVLHAHQLGEHLRPGDHRDLQAVGLEHLGVVRAHRGGDDDDLGVLDVGRVVTGGDAPAEHAQALGDRGRREVRAADVVAEVQQHLGDPAHADPADAHEVDALDLPDEHPVSPLRPARASGGIRPRSAPRRRARRRRRWPAPSRAAAPGRPPAR